MFLKYRSSNLTGKLDRTRSFMQIISNTTKTETWSAIGEGNVVNTSEVRVAIMKVHLLLMQKVYLC